MQIPVYLLKRWLIKKVKRVSRDSENVGGGLRGWPAWWRARRWRAPAAAPVANRCCSFRRTRNWEMNTFNTHLITTWPADQSYVRSRTAEQCFFVFSEPKNHHQAEIEADPELGPGADATLWYRSREGIVRGQWPDRVDDVTVLFDWHVGWLLCDYCVCLHTCKEKCTRITVREWRSDF